MFYLILFLISRFFHKLERHKLETFKRGSSLGKNPSKLPEKELSVSKLVNLSKILTFNWLAEQKNNNVILEKVDFLSVHGNQS